MPRQNKTEFALLGLLALNPASGYDLKRMAEESLAHFWHESYGHIYPMLRRLHKKGLVSRRREETEGRPPRYVYAVTAAGRAKLDSWLSQPVETVKPRNEILLKLFFGRFSSPDALAGVVAEYRTHLESVSETFDELEERFALQPPDAQDLPYWEMIIAAGRASVAAMSGWTEQTLNDLERSRPGPRRGD